MPEKVIQDVVYAAKAEGAGDDEEFSPGETIESDAGRLFTVAGGKVLGFSADSDDPALAAVSVSVCR